MRHPLLSIAIPTYNRRPWLEKCLAKFFEQIPGLPVEVVVSDNASTDDTWDYLKDMAAQHDQLRIVRNEGNTICANFRDVVSHASGEYTWMFGDDDEPLEGAVRRVLELITTGRDWYILHCVPADREGIIVGPPIPMLLGERGSWDLTRPNEVDSYFQSLQSLAGIGGLISLLVAKRKPFLYGFRLTMIWGAESMYPHLAALLAASSVFGKLTVVPDALVSYQTGNDIHEGYDAWGRIMLDLRAVIAIAAHCIPPQSRKYWFEIVRRHHGVGTVQTLRWLRDDLHPWSEAREALLNVGYHPDVIAMAELVSTQLTEIRYLK